MEALTPDQLTHAALQHDLDPAALRALIQVESGGRGFLPNGKCKILLERHLLYRRLRLPGRGIDPTALAQARPDLCGKSWDPQGHPYGTLNDQWIRLQAVIGWSQANAPTQAESYRKAAYEACSWGLFQLLGLNYESAGFANIYDFVEAHQSSEASQLAAILRWMQGNGLLGALQSKDWDRFARGYNGPGQVAHYATLLETAYHHATK